jgi:hypothetical protein
MLVSFASAQEGTAPFRLPKGEETPVFDRDVGGFGLGILLGLPTGISVAYRPDTGRVYADAALAWSFDRGTLHVHGDVLLRLADLRTDEIADVHFPVYLGLGPRMRFGNSPYTLADEVVELGLRVPIGMSFIHDDIPLEAFVELAPGIGLFPATTGTFDAAIGARYYFPVVSASSAHPEAAPAPTPAPAAPAPAAPAPAPAPAPAAPAAPAPAPTAPASPAP